MKIGQMYLITFKDHYTGHTDISIAQAIGKLVCIKKDSLTFSYWEVMSEDKEHKAYNSEYYTLITSAIDSIQLLTIGPKKPVPKALK